MQRWERRRPGGGNGKCKGPEAGPALLERGGNSEAVGAEDVGVGSQRKEFGHFSLWPGYNFQVGGRGRGKVRVRAFGLCLTETLWGMDLGVQMGKRDH